MDNNQILAVWGSPGSGKSTTSVKLAKALSQKKKNVIVVFTDYFSPTLLSVLPNLNSSNKSLGALLSEQEITQEKIMKNAITMKENEFIAFLGYGSGENKFSYAEYTKEKIIDLIILLRHMADYIIIDCTSIITEDTVTLTALEMADRVLRLSSCDLKGVSYHRSQTPLLSDKVFKRERHIKTIVNTNDSLLKNEIIECLSGVDIYIPYLKEVKDQAIQGELLSNLGTKPSRAYNESIGKILKGVFNE